ncbi:MAG: lipopolysaccharide biosynthesis protein RfbH [Planctomycetota bacterium]
MNREIERNKREEILRLVREYGILKSQEQPFVPGKSIVRYAGRVFGPEELVLATESALDFWLTSGRFTEEFESRLSEFFDERDVLMVNSGSSANLLAVTALTSPKLGDRRLVAGDEVITVAAGFPTTIAPIIQNRLIPVFVDVSLGQYNALPEMVANAVGPRTKAIVLAHTLGNPWDIDVISKIAQEHNLWLVEDTCDALGALYGEQKVGTFGDLATLSFYPAHHITTGEGGAVVCSNEQLAQIVRSYRDWGRDCYCKGGENNTCGKRFSQTQSFGKLPPGYDHKYVYSHIGYNLKATEFQAAIGCAQLERLSGFIGARNRNHGRLMEALSPQSDVFVLPEAVRKSTPSWFAFALTVRPEAPFGRNDIVQQLYSRKIETRNLFSGNLLRHPGFLDIEHRVVGTLYNTERIMNDTFFVGIFPGLLDEEVDYMAETITQFVESY